MQANGGMQAAGRSPRPIADSGDEFSWSFRGDQWDADSVDGKSEVWCVEPCDVHLQAFNGGIDIAGGATTTGFFAEHVPRFECLANVDADSCRLELSDAWAAEFEVWCKPAVIEIEACLLEPCGDVAEVVPEEVRKQAAIVECGAPMNEWFTIRLLPECRHKGSHQQLLREAHAGVWGHFEASEFDESESSG